MEAKDTVMNDRQIEEYCGVSINTHIPKDKKRLAQAEISFKAGIREGVEWFMCEYPGVCGEYLQVKLKEWGL